MVKESDTSFNFAGSVAITTVRKVYVANRRFKYIKKFRMDWGDLYWAAAIHKQQ
jgi:hypothetical protein